MNYLFELYMVVNLYYVNLVKMLVIYVFFCFIKFDFII